MNTNRGKQKNGAKTEEKPKGASKGKPKGTAKAKTILTPKHQRKKAPIINPVAVPITAPETATITIYSIVDWEAHHSISPHSYGNNGKQIGEFHTEADAKAWLRQAGHFGHFAAVERKNGKIGKSWHIEIEAPETESDFIEDEDAEYGMLDEDELDDVGLLNPEIVRSKIEIAKLKAQLEARSKNGGQSSIEELLEGLKALDEMRGGHKSTGGPVDLVDQIRAIKELEATLTPKREPQPAQRSLSEELTELMRGDLLKQIRQVFSNPEKAIGADYDEESRTSNVWDFLKAAVQSPVAEALAPLINQLGQQLSIAQGINGSQQPGSQQPRTAPATNGTKPASQTDQQQTALPQTQATNHEAAYGQMLTQILTILASNGPVEDAVKAIDGFLLVYPQYTEFINQQFGQGADVILNAISTIPGCESIPTLPTSKEWIERFQEIYFPEDDVDQAEPNAAGDTIA